MADFLTLPTSGEVDFRANRGPSPASGGERATDPDMTIIAVRANPGAGVAPFVYAGLPYQVIFGHSTLLRTSDPS